MTQSAPQRETSRERITVHSDGKHRFGYIRDAGRGSRAEIHVRDDDGPLYQAVRAGFPLGVIDELPRKTFLSSADVSRLIINRRTATHRRNRNQPLTPEESERVVRILRAIELAFDAFGSEEKAQRWLRKPKRFLDGQAPLDALETETGGRIIHQKLIALRHDFAA